MTTDPSPREQAPHPRIWWDGHDFAYLLPGPLLGQDGYDDVRQPGFYRARKAEDVGEDWVELRAVAVSPDAPPPGLAERFAAAAEAVEAIGWHGLGYDLRDIGSQLAEAGDEGEEVVAAIGAALVRPSGCATEPTRTELAVDERMELLDFIHRHRREATERREGSPDLAEGMALVVDRLARMLEAIDNGTWGRNGHRVAAGPPHPGGPDGG